MRLQVKHRIRKPILLICLWSSCGITPLQATQNVRWYRDPKMLFQKEISLWVSLGVIGIASVTLGYQWCRTWIWIRPSSGDRRGTVSYSCPWKSLTISSLALLLSGGYYIKQHQTDRFSLLGATLTCLGGMALGCFLGDRVQLSRERIAWLERQRASAIRQRQQDQQDVRRRQREGME